MIKYQCILSIYKSLHDRKGTCKWSVQWGINGGNSVGKCSSTVAASLHGGTKCACMHVGSLTLKAV